MLNIFKEIYKTLVDWIVDLRSTRNQLIWIAVCLFIWSVLKGVDVTILAIVAGWMTTIVGAYFYSKHQEYKNAHEIKLQEGVKIVAPSFDPDEVK
jgi:uncharacterized membrane protein YraQ (UPF0718 family)